MSTELTTGNNTRRQELQNKLKKLNTDQLDCLRMIKEWSEKSIVDGQTLAVVDTEKGRVFNQQLEKPFGAVIRMTNTPQEIAILMAEWTQTQTLKKLHSQATDANDFSGQRLKNLQILEASIKESAAKYGYDNPHDLKNVLDSIFPQ